MFASAAVAAQRGSHRKWLILEAILLVAILAAALGLRLSDTEGPRSSFPDLFDEGQDTESLLLMSRGFWPYRDIYVSQGPLKLLVMYPGYALFGGTLGAVRLWIGLLSVVGLVGAWWAGRQAAGPVGGLASALVLSAAPPYLEASRQSLAEIPSLVPSIWAVGCALRWCKPCRTSRRLIGDGGRPFDPQRAPPKAVEGAPRAGDGEGWLYAAVGLATLGVLVKPMAVTVAAPLGLLILSRPGVRPRQVAIAAGLALGVAAASILILGPADFYQQVVQYRVGAREGSSWSFRISFKQVVVEPFRSQPGLFILAAIGALLLIRANWRWGSALAAWPLATMAVLLLYTPLHPKHLTYLYPPLALLGGAGIGRAAWLAWKEGPAGRPTRVLTVGIAAVLMATPLGGAPVILDEVAPQDDDPDLLVFNRDAADSLRRLSDPRDFVLTDHPYLALLAQRMVPPKLVDISFGRIRAGVLTDRDVIGEAERLDTRLVFPWADRLRRLPGVPPWLDRNYELSHVFGSRSVKIPRGAKDRSIYLRRDTDLTAARESLERGLAVPEKVDFEGKLLMLGATVSSESLAARDQITLTVGWLAMEPMSSDYHVTVQLVGPRGEMRHGQEHDLDGGAQGTSTWEPGRWLFRTFAVQPEKGTPAGQYRLRISITDPKTGRSLRAVPEPGSVHFREDEPGSLTVATLQVR